jgi:hypothetical protein
MDFLPIFQHKALFTASKEGSAGFPSCRKYGGGSRNQIKAWLMKKTQPLKVNPVPFLATKTYGA